MPSWSLWPQPTVARWLWHLLHKPPLCPGSSIQSALHVPAGGPSWDNRPASWVCAVWFWSSGCPSASLWTRSGPLLCSTPCPHHHPNSPTSSPSIWAFPTSPDHRLVIHPEWDLSVASRPSLLQLLGAEGWGRAVQLGRKETGNLWSSCCSPVAGGQSSFQLKRGLPLVSEQMSPLTDPACPEVTISLHPPLSILSHTAFLGVSSVVFPMALHLLQRLGPRWTPWPALPRAGLRPGLLPSSGPLVSCPGEPRGSSCLGPNRFGPCEASKPAHKEPKPVSL